MTDFKIDDRVKFPDGRTAKILTIVGDKATVEYEQKSINAVPIESLTKLKEEKVESDQNDTPEIKWKTHKRTLMDVEDQNFKINDEIIGFNGINCNHYGGLWINVEGVFKRKDVKQLADTLLAIYNATDGE